MRVRVDVWVCMHMRGILPAPDYLQPIQVQLLWCTQARAKSFKEKYSLYDDGHNLIQLS
jgi:hypothetical protein